MEVWSGWNASTRLAYVLLFWIWLALVMEKENISESGPDIIKGAIIPDDVLINKIYVIRDHKVMLDSDLAKLYGVETRILNQAVNRNLDRFPEDFMFQLGKEEWANLKSQFVISSWGGRRKAPFTFTEQGVAMFKELVSELKTRI